jgi:hypothetical protein
MASLRIKLAAFVAVLCLVGIFAATASADNGLSIQPLNCSSMSYGDTVYAGGSGLIAFRDGVPVWQLCSAPYASGPKLTSAVPVPSGTCMTVFGPDMAQQRCTF